MAGPNFGRLISGAENPDIDVLIVGAGPVGLATAIELGQRGIRCLVVERNDRVGYSPRAKTTNVRTREHLRRWGIADALRKASPMPPDYPSDVVFATRMSGQILARFENAFNGRRERNNRYSEEAQWVPQYLLEEVLRVHAASLPGVKIEFQKELVSFVQSEQVVTAQIKSLASGEIRKIESAYLVGADGARSSVRHSIGAEMVGSNNGLRNYTIIFKSPTLNARHKHGRAIMYWMVNEDVPSLLGPMDDHGLWFFMATKLDVDPATIDSVDLIRRGTGLPDLPIEIVGTDAWIAHQLVADRYSGGRVFLVGDSCHLHPPFGGFGMNMGISDAVDIGWKLAATLQGCGGPNLLDIYQEERQPVHERTIAESIVNYGVVDNQLLRPGLEDSGPIGDATRREIGDIIQATKIREFKTLGIVLGTNYDNSPIVIPDGSRAPVEHFMLYVPSAYPGCLAPHLWLKDGSSLYDHFGRGFTLLVVEGDAADADNLVAQAASRHLPLKVLMLGDARLRPRYEARFALIRPDQHVAWRGNEIPVDIDDLLGRITGHHSKTGSQIDVASAA